MGGAGGDVASEVSGDNSFSATLLSAFPSELFCLGSCCGARSVWVPDFAFF